MGSTLLGIVTHRDVDFLSQDDLETCVTKVSFYDEIKQRLNSKNCQEQAYHGTSTVEKPVKWHL